jgi:hypothetical protein
MSENLTFWNGTECISCHQPWNFRLPFLWEALIDICRLPCYIHLLCFIYMYVAFMGTGIISCISWLQSPCLSLGIGMNLCKALLDIILCILARIPEVLFTDGIRGIKHKSQVNGMSFA